MCNSKNKACALYASDEHLITMLMSYMNKKLKSSVITVFEKDYRNISERICMSMKKNEIREDIDWNKTNISELNKKINQKLENKTIIVVGENKYIENVNALLRNINENYFIINCFNIFKNEKRIRQIIEENELILTTIGIEKIKKTITCIS